jgi:DNA-binding NtrC family response regulator
METLKVYRRGELLAQVVLGERAVEFGRGAACDVVIDDPELAERQWLAMSRGGTVVAYDVSTGGRARAQHLPLGERVMLGRDHSLMREHVADAPRTGAARDTEALRVLRESKASLCIVIGRVGDARRVCVGEHPIQVGRDADSDIVVSDPTASFRHCRLEPSRDGLFVRDLGSSNGTFVNGMRVDRALLSSGAVVRVGRTELCVLERDGQRRLLGTDLVAVSKSMLAMFAEAQRAAKLPWPALVLGETGSGKEGVAALLHEHGPRRGKPFVAKNAGGIPVELVESELFGHERGAFTSAVNAHRGVFEQADGGTLFLDEIGELPLSMQARLLRVLESGELSRVGAESARRVDVRLVCATHRDLRAMVALGTFRQDLYFRIAGLVIEVPPLRERPEDVRALSRHFLVELEGIVGPRVLTAQAMERLCAYAWPGNVRELRNIIRAAAIDSGAQRIEHTHVLRAIARLGASTCPPTLSDEELRDAIAANEGNLTAASRSLGLPRSTFRGRIERMSGSPDPVEPRVRR